MEGRSQSGEEIGEEVFRRCLAPQAEQIVETIRNDRAPLPSLEAAISATPVLAARLIVLANLAKGSSQRIATVSQATSSLGLDCIKPLLLGLLAFEPKPEASTPRDENLEATAMPLRELWEHALATAMLAAKIANKLDNVAPMHAFTAGFIHDIGRALLWRYSDSEFSAALLMSRQQQLSIREAETRATGIDHVAMGDTWCRKCEIIAPLAEVVCRHHEPITALNDSVDDGVQRLIAVIQAAESLSEKEPFGLMSEGLPECAGTWSLLGLSGAVWTKPLQIINSEIEALRETFGFPRFDPPPGLYRRETARVAASVPVAAPKSGVAGRGQVIPFPVSADTAARFEAQTPPDKLVLLVVEDHGSLCDMVRLFLMRHGYHVRTANNGEVALEILAREEIHMVLLDLMLPRLDGFEVLRQIHKSRQEEPPYIIVVSAGASNQDRNKVLELGANEYMPKPFHLARLLERVQAVEKYLL